MASDDVESQLTAQLDEQREALHQVKEAIAGLGEDTDDAGELLEMQEALLAAIKELEAALLQLKKEKLLAALDAKHPVGQAQSLELHTTVAILNQSEEARASASQHQDSRQSFTIQPGQPCRFRADNGCWYAGRLDRLEDDWAHVSFDMPTRPHMLEGCKVQASGLRPARIESVGPQVYQVGDVVYVRPSCMSAVARQLTSPQSQAGLPQGLWLEADVVEVDDMSGRATVSIPNGPRMSLDFENITLCAEAGNSDLDSGSDNGDDSDASAGTGDDDNASSGENESEIDEEERSGLGSGLDVFGHARLAVAAGIHTGTRHFAEWESHTRGIASKLMAKMGYKAGSGLGNTNKGIAAPVEVLLLPGKAGLGASEGMKPEGHGQHHAKKRRKGGGERNRRKKQAAARRAAAEGRKQEEHEKQLQGEEPGLFGFINNALGDSSEAAAKIRAVEASFLRQDRVGQQDGGRGSSSSGTSASRQQASRHRLIDQQKIIEDCNAKVAHFQAMLKRNATNATLAPQIAARLKDAQAELQRAAAEQARMSTAVRQAENNKKMLKF